MFFSITGKKKKKQNVGGENNSENTGVVHCLHYNVINKLIHMFVNTYTHTDSMQMNLIKL